MEELQDTKRVLLPSFRWQRICLQCGRLKFNCQVEKIPQRRERLPTLIFLPGECHRQRSLVGYSPGGRKELHTTKVTLHANSFSDYFLI